MRSGKGDWNHIVDRVGAIESLLPPNTITIGSTFH